MFALTSSLGLLVSEIPAVVEVIVTGGWPIAVSVGIGMLPTCCDEQFIQHLVQFSLCFGFGLVDLNSIEILVMNNVVLQ